MGGTWVEGSDCMAGLYMRCCCRAAWLLLPHAACSRAVPCAVHFCWARMCDNMYTTVKIKCQEACDHIIYNEAREREARVGDILWPIMSCSYEKRPSVESRSSAGCTSTPPTLLLLRVMAAN